MATKTAKAVCKFGACEPQCGMEFDIEDNIIVRVRPDKEHPISKGYVCIKGMAIPEYQNDTDRLIYPEKRVDGRLERTDWTTATTEIGQKLRKLLEQYGPTSIATYWGNAADTSAMIAANTLCSSLGSPNSYNVLSLEYTDRGIVAEELFGDQTMIFQPDANDTDFALLLGTNPLVTQGMSLLQRRPRIGGDLKDIQKRGGKVVVVDPRKTETTKISDQHIMIRPGTDLFLLLGMMKHIIEQRLYDDEFINLRTNGFSRWIEIVKKISMKRISEITEIELPIIRTLAEEYANANSAFITTRVGVQTSHNTTLTEWLVQSLNAVTGRLDQKGGMFFNPGAINNTDLIHLFTKRKNPADSRVSGYPQIFGGPPASEFADDVLSEDEDRIRALIVIAGNPVISFPNTKKMEKALESLELLVCIDIYQSDTGTFADYNLPAATIYEKGGFHFLTQSFEPVPFAEWKHKLVEPKGEARPEWDMIRDISRAANIRFLNNPIINAVDKIMSFFGSGFSEENFAQFLLMSPFSRQKMTLNNLKKRQHGVVMGELEKNLFFDKYIRTPDKRINLTPLKFTEELDRVLDIPPLPSEQYPLLLISGGRRLASFNTWTHNIKSLTDNLKGNFATMNVSDASKREVKDGDIITITTETGKLALQVHLTEEIKQGVVMVHQFWGHHYNSGQTNTKFNQGYNVNILHSDQKLDALCGMPVFNGTPCAVIKENGLT